MFALRAAISAFLLIAAPAVACPNGADWFSFAGGAGSPTPRLIEHGNRATAAIGLSPDFIYMQVDGAGIQAWGIRAEGRVQRRGLAAVLDAGIYNALQAAPGPRGEPGTLGRVSADLRWEPVAWRMDSSAAVAPFVELGLGIERWTFDVAPPRQRYDASLGAGLHMHGGSTDSRSPRHIGVTLLARLLLAHGTEDPTGIAHREASPSPPALRTDVGVELGLAVTWGRRGTPPNTL
jgi:hypothetical protein